MLLPTITRRTLLTGAGTTLAGAAIAVPYVNAARADDVCSVSAEAVADPLLNAISAYRLGLAEFETFARTNVTDEERDDYAATSYQPPMVVLDEWDKPATSLNGAVEALRLAVDEYRDFGGSDMIGRLLYAALAYFDPATA